MTRLVRLAFTKLLWLVYESRIAASLVTCNDDALLEPFVTLVRHGHFSRARWQAHEILQANPSCQRKLSALFVQESPSSSLGNEDASTDQDHWTSGLFHVLDDDEHHRLIAVKDADDCWAYQITEGASWLPPDLWSRCCSQLPQEEAKNEKKKHASSSNLFGEDTAIQGSNNDVDNDDECVNDAHQRLCCDFVQGSSSYLHLPLLHELAIRLRLQTDDQTARQKQPTKTYNLQQDGFLRPYDPSGILWPTSYLLSLCVAAPKRCGIPEIYQAAAAATMHGSNLPIAIELGAGLGTPSIVLADTLQQYLWGQRYANSTTDRANNQPLVLATDVSRAALALVRDNARTAKASVTVQTLDFFNQTSIQNVAATANDGGFAIVLGSSLMALFDESNPQPLWQVLNALLSRDNPHAVAILAHSLHALPDEANHGLRLVRRISGTQFDMCTRQDAQASDFEISVYARRRRDDDDDSMDEL